MNVLAYFYKKISFSINLQSQFKLIRAVQCQLINSRIARQLAVLDTDVWWDLQRPQSLRKAMSSFSVISVKVNPLLSLCLNLNSLFKLFSKDLFFFLKM